MYNCKLLCENDPIPKKYGTAYQKKDAITGEKLKRCGISRLMHGNEAKEEAMKKSSSF